MPLPRYSLIIADRGTGVSRRFALPFRPTVALAAALILVPLTWGLYVGWNTQATIDRLTLQNAHLELENTGYRAAANDLSIQIASLQTVMLDLAVRTDINPMMRASIDRLPDDTHAAARLSGSAELDTPSQTFDQLHAMLGTIDSRLQLVRQSVAYREALADATPIIWPAAGWISAAYGYRADPFTGQRNFHPAVDISTRKGQPVSATATGRVFSASRNGAYGNLVEIDHGFGLTTRYGHLSEFAVAVGDTVMRGDLIGFVGATGRATGYHVHYEVWAHGRSLNPMRLLVESRPFAAN